MVNQYMRLFGAEDDPYVIPDFLLFNQLGWVNCTERYREGGLVDHKDRMSGVRFLDQRLGLERKL